MITGYFEDIHLSLKTASRILKEGAPMAYVLGNVRYHGITVPVDEIVVEIAESLQLRLNTVLAARYRGNSAQQMGKYGRRPSRESVVLLQNSK